MSTRRPAFDDPDVGRAVTRHMGLTLRETTVPGGPVTVVGDAAAAPHLRAPEGHVWTGALLTLADSVAGICGGLAVLPEWIVSTNLMLRTASFVHAGPLHLEAEVLRAGRNAAVTAVRVLDAGRGMALLAEGVLTSTVLHPEGGPPNHARPLHIVAPPPPPEGLPAVPEFFRLRPEDDDVVVLDLADELRNPWGILHGGGVATLVDAATVHAAAAREPGPWATADVVLHFLRPARIGPVVAWVEVLGVRPDGIPMRVEVRDRGAQDRVVAVAVTTARRP